MHSEKRSRADRKVRVPLLALILSHPRSPPTFPLNLHPCALPAPAREQTGTLVIVVVSSLGFGAITGPLLRALGLLVHDGPHTSAASHGGGARTKHAAGGNYQSLGEEEHAEGGAGGRGGGAIASVEMQGAAAAGDGEAAQWSFDPPPGALAGRGVLGSAAAQQQQEGQNGHHHHPHEHHASALDGEEVLFYSFPFQKRKGFVSPACSPLPLCGGKQR